MSERPDWREPGVVLEVLRVEPNTPYVWVTWRRPDGFVREARVHERDLRGWPAERR